MNVLESDGLLALLVDLVQPDILDDVQQRRNAQAIIFHRDGFHLPVVDVIRIELDYLVRGERLEDFFGRVFYIDLVDLGIADTSLEMLRQTKDITRCSSDRIPLGFNVVREPPVQFHPQSIPDVTILNGHGRTRLAVLARGDEVVTCVCPGNGLDEVLVAAVGAFQIAIEWIDDAAKSVAEYLVVDGHEIFEFTDTQNVLQNFFPDLGGDRVLGIVVQAGDDVRRLLPDERANNGVGNEQEGTPAVRFLNGRRDIETCGVEERMRIDIDSVLGPGQSSRACRCCSHLWSPIYLF